MAFSTPIDNKKGRRRTLMLVDTPIPTEPINDESERTSRRSIIEVHKKAQETPTTPINESFRFNGEQEMKDHLQLCIKLFSENKITTGVAWQLHIIDLLGILSKKQSSNTLQVASTSLDIGAKVYGLRVDDLHAQGLKLAHSMSRFVEKNQLEDKGNEVEDDAELGNNATQPTRKKRKRVRNTIVKDRNTLLTEIPQLESVFFSNRIDSSLSTVENLFTNSLPMDSACYKLLALGGDKAWTTGPDETLDCLQEQKNFNTDLLPKTGNICVPFQNFILNLENAAEEEQSQTENNAEKLLEDVVVYDNQGIPVPELDGTIHDVFNDFDAHEEDDDVPNTEDFLTHQVKHDVPHIVDLITSDMDFARSEYSYNSLITLGSGKVIEKIWAGPSHWKLKCIKRDKSIFSGNVEEAQSIIRQKKKIKRYEPQPLDFKKGAEARLALENMVKIKFKKRLVPDSKITLPLSDENIRSMMDNLYELMIKPFICKPKDTNAIALNKTQDEVNTMDHLDEDNHDIGMDDGMDHMDNDPGNDIEEGVEALNVDQNFMGDNLVDAPEYIPKVYIPYAQQAKKMDMKKLKGFMWQILSEKAAEKSKKIDSTTFSKAFSDVSKVLPQSMKKELTCALAFSALLHLCNENTLKLTQLNGCEDFTIESG
ncbi:condensin complex subunit 2-like isoform X1 [Harmonia axyridis]|uniref:condensin complex subunit 2-like isoform X1 n=2 Tax=Harmonia axyridis TaxID=115357 RepID=UPI001E276462|nr:condensin complex subunit 2-like isoform X1 [Harmonia axyridis]